MIELNGKYNFCKVYTDEIDNETIGQLIALMNQKSAEGSKIRIMPDCHAGAGCVVGTTMTLSDRVIPNLVGVDIGCGMRAIKLKEKSIDLPALDSVIKKYVPSGFARRNEAIAVSNADKILADVDTDEAFKSLGTLGGGNHFIEVDRGSDGALWLVIHTGSRHLGIEVCSFYQNLAYEKLKRQAAGGDISELSRDLIGRLKAEGRSKEISRELKKLNDEYKSKTPDVPQALAYVTGEDFVNYLHDMKLAQEHAKINRLTIAKQILKHAKLHETESFDTIHNYIDTESMILRKGAISAQSGERVIIPMNMRDGSLLCVGRGNPDWNFSAPHGAGRIMSRSQAKQSVSMKDFKDSMAGIYSTSVSRSTIDESPMAYKPMQSILDNIGESVEVVDIIKPIYNFKAGEEQSARDR